MSTLVDLHVFREKSTESERALDTSSPLVEYSARSMHSWTRAAGRTQREGGGIAPAAQSYGGMGTRVEARQLRYWGHFDRRRSTPSSSHQPIYRPLIDLRSQNGPCAYCRVPQHALPTGPTRQARWIIVIVEAASA